MSMIFARMATIIGPRYGLVEDDSISQVAGDVLGGRWRRAGLPRPLAEARLIAPVTPSKIVAVGLNYRAHAAETGNPLPTEPRIFYKPPSSVIGPGRPIVLAAGCQRHDHEAELVAVIGRKASRVPVEEALNYVCGYTCGNDVSARDYQRLDQMWRAKGADTFSPTGPWIATGIDPGTLDIQALVNGEVKQSSNTSDLIFDVAYLISYVSAFVTLYPGDLLFTGTPAGVSPLQPGDMMEIRISGIGSLANPVLGPVV
jgi:2-keto-4-pentenoate hydratase/2-oxohepta-3-ene-1,7-dioic acid hydratase in catechol pathway